MQNNPLVSCIVPIYNAKKYFKFCLDSCVSQTYPNFEIILVDDGSTDGSLQIAKNYLSHSNIILIELNQNYGVSIARNCGLDFALKRNGTIGDEAHPYIKKIHQNHRLNLQSDFIIFIDNDDALASKDSIKQLVGQALKTEADITLGIFSLIDEQGKLIQIGKHNSIIKDHNLISSKRYLSLVKRHCFTFVTGGLIKTNLLKEIRFPESIIIEDLEFGFECFLKAQTISCVTSPSYYYRVRYGSISHASTFHHHNIKLIARSFFHNTLYLKNLLLLYPNESFTHLIKRCLKYNASPAITASLMCQYKTREELKELLPYANLKAKLCFYFPKLFKFLKTFREKFK
ncbi:MULTISPECIES: glycosyltransferase family 2 protein [unclassified Helicobacter]|uniref:glycosyltransferase family 2 protein n=1 Tax=unclassified Helicobacter TaxID=2593540 RepID=UPI000CF112AE|nr:MULTISPECIES: glycosyltransferase family 2 protein [unclassified Helicobacter]